VLIKLAIICQASAYAQSYQVITGAFTWHQAKADAEARGGRLAVLNTQIKINNANAYLLSISPWPHLWIGLTDEETEGTFKWISGDPLTISSWQPNEPNNTSNLEDYCHIVSSSSVPSLWNDAKDTDQNGYLLEIQPLAPTLNVSSIYESVSGISVTVNATPISGYPTNFTYKWYFNGFLIPANFGGTASSFLIGGDISNNGSWKVIVTNSQGSAEATFQYRVFQDTDGDGLSDYRETNILLTNPAKADTDDDGFSDSYELTWGYDPRQASSTPAPLVTIHNAVEVRFTTDLSVSYSIERSTDLATWVSQETGIIGTGQIISRLYSTIDTDKVFFRVLRSL
jgi:hypothetical protein